MSFDKITILKFLLPENDASYTTFTKQKCEHLQFLRHNFILSNVNNAIRHSLNIYNSKFSILKIFRGNCEREKIFRLWRLKNWIFWCVKPIVHNYCARRLFRINTTILSPYWRNEARRDETRCGRRRAGRALVFA